MVLATHFSQRRFRRPRLCLSHSPSPSCAAKGDVLKVRSARNAGADLAKIGYRLKVNDLQLFVRGSMGADSELHAHAERRLRAAVVAAEERRHLFFEGRSWPLVLVDTLHVGGEGEEVSGGLRAPMPGKVITLAAEPGTAVGKGAALLVMERWRTTSRSCAACIGMRA